MTRRWPSLGRVLAVAVVGLAGREVRAQSPVIAPPPPCELPRGMARLPAVPLDRATTLIVSFADSSADESARFLAPGLLMSITEQLRAIPRLGVRSRSDERKIQSLLTQSRDVVSRELGVKHLVEGTVKSGTGMVELRLRLVQASNDSVLWEKRVSGLAGRLSQLQGELVDALAARLGGGLTGAEQAILRAQRPDSPAAYLPYIQGRLILRDGGARRAQQAVEYFEEAVRADPSFALGFAALASAYAEWAEAGGSSAAPTGAIAESGLTAAATARRLSGGLVESRIAEARLRAIQQPREGAAALSAASRAVADAPGDARAYYWQGRLLLDFGDPARASVALIRATELDPHDARPWVLLAESDELRGRPSQACRSANAAIVVDPWARDAYSVRAAARAQLGEIRHAYADAETAVRLGEMVCGGSVLVLIDILANEPAAAKARIRRLREAEARANTTMSIDSALCFGRALTRIGDSTSAIAVLSQARPRGAKLWFGLRRPEFDSLRSNVQFSELLSTARPIGGPNNR